MTTKPTHSYDHCFSNPGELVAGWLAGWEINVPFQYKIGYSRDKVLGGDLVLPG